LKMKARAMALGSASGNCDCVRAIHDAAASGGGGGGRDGAGVCDANDGGGDGGDTDDGGTAFRTKARAMALGSASGNCDCVRSIHDAAASGGGGGGRDGKRDSLR
jgi:hypothetical protein